MPDRTVFLAKHDCCLIAFNLDRHLPATRGAQPKIFKRAEFAWRIPGTDQIEPSFMEIVKRIKTGRIRALGKHAISKL
jgi:hypothetical protein